MSNVTGAVEMPLVENLRLLANAHARESAAGARRALLLAASEIERLRAEIAILQEARDRIYVSSAAAPDQ